MSRHSAHNNHSILNCVCVSVCLSMLFLFFGYSSSVVTGCILCMRTLEWFCCSIQIASNRLVNSTIFIWVYIILNIKRLNHTAYAKRAHVCTMYKMYTKRLWLAGEQRDSSHMHSALSIQRLIYIMYTNILSFRIDLNVIFFYNARRRYCHPSVYFIYICIQYIVRLYIWKIK